jgi:hypothetical protein
MIANFFVVPFNTAENHLDYLQSKNMLPDLKGGGWTVRTQSTTTNCTATTTEKLLCNNTNFVNTLNLIWNLNGNSPEYKEVEDHFTLNRDESNFMASEGTVRVIGNKKKRKQEKNSNDSCESITGFCVGSTAGTEGPHIFLIAGKTLDNYPSMKIKKFAKTYKAPPGSHVVPTPSAYMTNQVWIEMAETVAMGIRAMPVIKDHPDWWCLLSLDGYGSHLKIEALETFAKYSILVIKEEGDSSHVCQAYNQLVAKQDKRVTRDLLEGFRFLTHGVINQFELVFISKTAINAPGSAKAWQVSHIRVNMCPSQMEPFTDWLKKHGAAVSAADWFFKSQASLFDAMPAM